MFSIPAARELRAAAAYLLTTPEISEVSRALGTGKGAGFQSGFSASPLLIFMADELTGAAPLGWYAAAHFNTVSAIDAQKRLI